MPPVAFSSSSGRCFPVLQFVPVTRSFVLASAACDRPIVRRSADSADRMIFMTVFPLDSVASSLLETGRVEQGDLFAVDVEAYRMRLVVDGDARGLEGLRRGRLDISRR